MIQEQELKNQAVQEQMLPVQQLEPNPWNRKTFNAQGLQELSDSIKSKGILEPLVVKKVNESKYQIASGERRWRAALQAGFKEVPCRVLELTDASIQDMNLIANIQREDIPALEKAAMVKALMDAEQLTQAQTAARLGKSADWVTDLLAVLTLPQDVQKKLADFSLGTRPMQAIASLPNAEYKSQIVKELQDGKIKPEHVEHRAHQLHNGFKASQAKKIKKAGIQKTDVLDPDFRRGDDDRRLIANSTSSPAVVSGGSTVAPNGKADTGSVANGQTPVSFRQLITALKDDLADKYLSRFGRVGGVLRAGLDKAWQAPKMQLIKWSLAFAVVSLLWHPVLKAVHYAFNRLTHVEVTKAATAVKALAVPTPAITGATYAAGHKVRLEWKPVGPGYSYKVYMTTGLEDPHYVALADGKAVFTAGALVDYFYNSGHDIYLAVMAVSPEGLESELSAPVQVHLTVSNQRASVEALSSERSSKRVSEQVKKSGIPVPSGVRAERTQNGFHFVWNSAGPGYRYNYYTAFAGRPETYEIENATPLTQPEAFWVPGDKTKTFDVVVTAVDAQGQESRYSGSIEVRP